MRKTLFTSLVLILLTAAAAPAYAGNAELFGLVGGGLAGGIIGNQFGRGTGNLAATAGGAFVGAYAGDRLGYAMDNAGRGGGYAYTSAPVNYYPYYAPTYTPNYVAPPAPSPADYAGSSAYVDADSGDTCRQITERVRVNGHVQESYGTACLQPDGSWRIVQ